MKQSSQRQVLFFVAVVLLLGIWVWRAYQLSDWLSLVMILFGSGVGFWMHMVDLLLHRWFVQQYEAFSRTPLFLAALVPLSFFVVTSTPNVLGKAVIAGVIARLVFEVWVENVFERESSDWTSVVWNLTASEKSKFALFILGWWIVCSLIAVFGAI